MIQIEINQIEKFKEEVQKEANVAIDSVSIFKILLVVGNPDRLQQVDYIISSALLLDRNKFDIQVVDDSVSSSEDAIDKDLIIISDSVSSNNVLAKFRDVTNAVLVFERAITRDMQLADSEGGTYGDNEGTVTVLDPTHPFFESNQILQNNKVKLIRNNRRFYQTRATTGATVLAHRNGRTNEHVLYYYKPGDIGRSSFVMPGYRVFFGLERSNANLSEETARFLLNLILKMLNNEYSN